MNDIQSESLLCFEYSRCQLTNVMTGFTGRGGDPYPPHLLNTLNSVDINRIAINHNIRNSTRNPFKVIMRVLSNAVKALIEEAVAEVNSGASIRRVALERAIPYSTLQRHAQTAARGPRLSSNSLKLSAVIEEDIVDWIVLEEHRGHAPKLRDVHGFALSILQSTDPEAILGRDWYQRFIKRHSESIKVKSARLLPIQKILTGRSPEIASWFHVLEHAITFQSITPANLYNMDETGLQENFTRAWKVIGSSKLTLGAYEQAQAGATSWTTIIEAISAEGVRVDPAVIFKGENVMKSWIGKPLPKHWFFSASKSGWTNISMTSEWLERIFLPRTKPSRVTDWRLLVLDGQATHTPSDFRQKAWENKVALLFLPANTSHRLQPLHVGVFGPLKTFYSDLVSRVMQESITGPKSKQFFLKYYVEASALAFSPKNIRSGFRATGIWPYMPSKVLQEVEAAEQPITPRHGSVEPSEHQDLVFKTPRSMRHYREQLEGLQSDLTATERDRRSFYSKVGHAMEHYDVLKAANKRRSTEDDIEAVKQRPGKKQRLTRPTGKSWIEGCDINQQMGFTTEDTAASHTTTPTSDAEG